MLKVFCYITSISTITQTYKATNRNSFFTLIFFINSTVLFLTSAITSKRFINNDWLKIHHNHCFHVNRGNINGIISEVSIVAGVMCYNNIWKNLFGNGFINLDIRGDRLDNVLWCARHLVFHPPLKIVVILCGTNNIKKDPPMIFFKD